MQRYYIVIEGKEGKMISLTSDEDVKTAKNKLDIEILENGWTAPGRVSDHFGYVQDLQLCVFRVNDAEDLATAMRIYNEALDIGRKLQAESMKELLRS